MNNNKIVLGVLLALVVVASGCVSSEGSKNTPKSDTKIELNTGLQNDEEIRKVTFTDDGETINCYVYDQHDGYAGMGGLSCIPNGVSNR